jgi:Tol biopolymer transport system component
LRAAGLLIVGLALALAACRAPVAPVGATAPPGLTGVLTYQRDGNVYALGVESKAERKLTDVAANTPALFSARSPDGSRVAYVRIEPMGSSLWIMHPDGSDLRQIVDEGTVGAMLERPQWTPDGTGIIFTYHGFLMEGTAIKGEVFRAERVNPDGSGRTVLAPDADGPTLAPDGSLAFVRNTRAGRELVLLPAGGGERVLVAERTFFSVAAPRFSPDGQRIAFTAVGDGPKLGGSGPRLGDLGLGPRTAFAHGEPWDIWVSDLRGEIRRVSKLAEDEPTVAWGEGGRYLAVSGGTGVYIVDVSTGQPVQLAKVGGFGGIDWTP